MTLRQTANSILETLRNSTIIGVEPQSIQFGRHGEMPALSPFIWIYCEPLPKPFGRSNIEKIRRAKFTIFAGAASSDQFDSQMMALEIAENCIIALLDNYQILVENITYSYDQTYADLSVAFVEFEVDYEIEGLQ